MRSDIEAMIGRESEQEVLGQFTATSRGRALALRGDAGVGKSALLDHTAELAAGQGHRVIRAAGVEAESELPFAGLHQFLHPLPPFINEMEEAHQRVFDVVFGRGQGTSPSVMTLGIAVLDLFSLATSQAPMLLVLDDGQWLDASSTEVCGFVGRRLTDSAVKLLVSLRAGVPSGFDTAALPELPVRPLSDVAAEELLDARHAGLEPRARRLVLDEAQGNPLALLELPAHVPGGGIVGASSIPGYTGIPVPERLHQVYRARIQSLPAPLRAELLRGAFDGVGAGSAADRTRGTRYRMRDADEAAALGLLDIDPLSGDVVFRHPLVRSTVIQMATPNERRAAHSVLADLHRGDLERRATHLAASTIDPDEPVAAVLEAAADSATRRGGALAAVAWLTRAAELSERPEERERRLGDAAYIAGHSGRLDQAQQLIGVGPGAGGSVSPASALATGYAALFADGDVRSTHSQVLAAAERMRDSGVQEPDELLTRLVDLLLVINQYASDEAA